MKRELSKLFSNNSIKLSILGLLCLLLFMSINDLNHPINTYLEELTAGNISLNEPIDNPQVADEMEFRRAYYDSFEDYLDNQYLNLSRMKDSPLFDRPKDQRLIDQQLATIEQLQEQEINMINDFYYLQALNNLPIIFFVTTLFILLVTYQLFIQDQELGLLKFYSTTKRGIHKLLRDKLFTLLFILFLCLFFICLGTLTILFMKDFPFNTPIQLIYGLRSITNQLTALTYYIQVFAFYGLVLLLLVGIFLVLYQSLRNVILSISMLGFFVFIQYLLYSFISLGSDLQILKFVNIFYFIFYPQNTDFTIDNSTLTFALSVATLLIIFFFLIFNNLYIKGKPLLTTKNSNPIPLKFSKTLIYQLFDLLITKKLALVFLILIAYSSYDYLDYQPVLSPSKLSYNHFRSDYLGEISDETLTQLQDQQEQIIQAQETINNLQEKIANNEMSEQDDIELQQAQAIIKDKMNVEIVLQEINGILQSGGTHYLDADGLNLWLQTNSTFYQFILIMIILFPVILLGSSIGNLLFKSNIGELASTTKRKDRFRHNYLGSGYLLSLSTIALIFILRYLKFNNYYPISITQASVSNYFSVNSNLSLNATIILYFLILIVVTISFLLFSIYLARYFSSMQSVGITFVFFVALYFLLPKYSQFLSPLYLKSALISVLYLGLTIGFSFWLRFQIKHH